MAGIKNLNDLKNLNKAEAMQNVADGMDAKKHKKQHICSNLVQCVLGIVMISIGGVYYKQCEFDATTYLVVGGSIMLLTNLLSIVAILTPVQWDDKLIKALTPLVGLAQFCCFLWGTIVVFGHYSGWTHDEAKLAKAIADDAIASCDDCCAYTPFMFAFVLLILTWVMLPFIIACCCCCACFAACCACCAGSHGDGGAVEPAKSTQQSDKEMEA